SLFIFQLPADHRALHSFPTRRSSDLVITDGRYAVCGLDRNGLRPSRWVITNDNFITVASEIGTYNYAPENVVAKGRVGPGQMLAIDTQEGKLLNTDEVDNALKAEYPYRQWLKEDATRMESQLLLETAKDAVPLSGDLLNTHQKLQLITNEERDQVLRPMGEEGQEATGSMGDDTPMAVLSLRVRHMADYFRQQFAQMTNPPIDPLREAIVMSLETCIGAEKNVFETAADHANRIILTSPVLSPLKYQGLKNTGRDDYRHQTLSMAFDPAIGL